MTHELLEPRLHLAAAPPLLRDLNTDDTFVASTNEVVEANGIVFFTASDVLHGAELWKIDDSGVAELVADLMPGPASSRPENLTAVNGALLFFAQLPGRGRVLLRSDGTAAGTTLVKDVTRATAPDALTFRGVVAGDRFLFTARNERTFSAYVSDGTPGGTRAIVKRSTDNAWSFNHAARLDQLLFFEHHNEILVLDTASAQLAGKLDLPGIAHVHGARQVGDNVFLATTHHDFRTRLWSIGQDLQPAHIMEFPPGDAGEPAPMIHNMTALGQNLLFTLHPHGPSLASQLWKSDGTEPGTARIAADAALTMRAWAPHAVWNGHAYFGAAADGLWRTDGTSHGTVRLDDPDDAVGHVTRIAPVGGQLVFAAGGGDVLWTTDGTRAGTRKLAEFSESTNVSAISPLAPTPAGHAFITADPAGLWITGPAPDDGTRPLPTPRIGTQSSDPRNFTTLAGDAYFVATTGPRQDTLFRIPADGADVEQIYQTTARILSLRVLGDHLFILEANRGKKSCCPPAHRLSSLAPGADAVQPIGGAGGYLRLLPVGNTLYFAASPGVGGEYVYFRTDGTPQGTHQVESTDLLDSTFHPTGDNLYFVHGNDLWVADPDLANPRPLHDAALTGGVDPDPSVLGSLGDRLFYVANDRKRGRLLWTTDGTADGTVQLADLLPGNQGPHYISGVPALGKFFFSFTHGPVQAWVSDGTPAGTLKLMESHEPNGAQPLHFQEFNGAVYFIVTNSDRMPELWRSDGTAAGTTRVKRFRAAADDAVARDLIVANGKLFFTLERSPDRYTLWSSDGTKRGTRALRRNLGPHVPYTPILATPDRLIFSADDAEHGLELWQSDGTPEGTTLLADILPGPSSSHPKVLGLFSDKLLISATDGEHGREPWLVTLDD